MSHLHDIAALKNDKFLHNFNQAPVLIILLECHLSPTCHNNIYFGMSYCFIRNDAKDKSHQRAPISQIAGVFVSQAQHLYAWFVHSGTGGCANRLHRVETLNFYKTLQYEYPHTLTLTFVLNTVEGAMRVQQAPDASPFIFRFNAETGDFVAEKDWDQFENCKQCRGRADIDETPEGDLVCRVCRATLPRPST